MPIKTWAVVFSASFMRITAFHMASKVEEAVRSYFLNSFVFASRKIDVERTADFRNHIASLQFFLHDGEEIVPMGGIEFSMIAEQSGKVAIQWKSKVLPAETANRAFMILSSGEEHCTEYTALADILKKQWEKDINSYLPKNEEAPPPVEEAPKSVEDEYASLSPEEIEAITGVRPETPAANQSIEEVKQKVDTLDTDAASEEEIKRLMGMMMNNPTESNAGAKPADSGSGMSEEEIAALAKDVQQQAEKTVDSSTASETTAPVPETEGKEEAAAEDQMSAEEIWRQINGGK